jgi:hypothetical protein
MSFTKLDDRAWTEFLSHQKSYQWWDIVDTLIWNAIISSRFMD